MLKKYIKKNQSTKVLVGFEIRKITINNHELKIAIIMVLYTNHHTIFIGDKSQVLIWKKYVHVYMIKHHQFESHN